MESPPMTLLGAVVVTVTLLILISTSCGAGAQNNQTCDPNSVGIQPIQDLDFDRLLNKKWYVQEMFARRPEDVVVAPPTFNCYMTYILHHIETKQLVEQYTDIASGVASFNGSWVFYDEFGDFAVWTLASNYTEEYTPLEKYKTTYTHTDYETFGIMHLCPYPDTADHPFERILTFTGIPNPEQALLDEMKGLVANLGFPTEYGVQIEHHSGCEYGLCQKKKEDENENACCDPSVVNVPPIVDIDFEQLFYKQWYVQEIFFREPAQLEVPSCYIQTLIPLWNENMILGETTTKKGANATNDYSLAVASEGNGAVWEVISHYTLNKFTTVFTHTDYETFGIMHYCPYLENSDHRQERVFTFTRDTAPDGALLQELRDKVATTLGFPIEHGVRIEHHEDCDYYYYYEYETGADEDNADFIDS